MQASANLLACQNYSPLAGRQIGDSVILMDDPLIMIIGRLMSIDFSGAVPYRFR
jgi:hypothetical protein